jgi:hypothetical protein
VAISTASAHLPGASIAPRRTRGHRAALLVHAPTSVDQRPEKSLQVMRGFARSTSTGNRGMPSKSAIPCAAVGCLTSRRSLVRAQYRPLRNCLLFRWLVLDAPSANMVSMGRWKRLRSQCLLKQGSHDPPVVLVPDRRSALRAPPRVRLRRRFRPRDRNVGKALFRGGSLGTTEYTLNPISASPSAITGRLRTIASAPPARSRRGSADPRLRIGSRPSHPCTVGHSVERGV